MSDLQHLINDFDLIAEIGYNLSQQFDGVQTSDRRKKVSTYYLAKVVPECMSLLRTLPGSRFTDSGEMFDFPSFCSISRNLIEAVNLHWYYCVERSEEAQVCFRFFLYDYHDYRTRISIGEFLQADEIELEELKKRCSELKERIKEHPSFHELLPEVQRQILKGRRCSELNQSEIIAKREIDVIFFNGLYKLLSNNTHSTPSAINTVVHTRLHGDGLQLAFTGLVLSYVASFISEMFKVIGDMWGLEFEKPESQETIYTYAESLYEVT